jgi:hypothetical protein
MLAAEVRSAASASVCARSKPEIHERLARLESPAPASVALELISGIACRTVADVTWVSALRDAAAFAARDFDILAALPCAPAIAGPPRQRRDRGRWRLQHLPPQHRVIQVRDVAGAAQRA